MPARVQLYYLPPSHYCVSAERMLAFKGIPAKRVYAPYNDRRELLRRTGQDYVPTLMWGGRAVMWRDIPDFLERVQPEPALLPKGREGLARTLENWGHQVLEERVWRAVVTQIPPHLRTEAERWVFEEMQTRARGPWAVQKARRAEFVRELTEYFGFVDEMLAGKEWLLGEPSLADFGVYGGLSPWLLVGEKIPKKFPDLAAWTRRIERL